MRITKPAACKTMASRTLMGRVRNKMRNTRTTRKQPITPIHAINSIAPHRKASSKGKGKANFARTMPYVPEGSQA
jgi:hypothetical protein